MKDEITTALEGAVRLATSDWHTASKRFTVYPSAANYAAMLNAAADYQAANYELREDIKQKAQREANTRWKLERLYARRTA